MKVINWIATAIFLTVISSGQALAGDIRNDLNNGEKCQEILLTQEQKQEALDARARYNAKIITIWAERAKAENQKERLMADEDFDFNALKQQARAIAAADAKADLAIIDGMAEIREILTNEQWKQYICLFQNMDPMYFTEDVDVIPGHGNSREIKEPFDNNWRMDISVDPMEAEQMDMLGEFNPFDLILP